MADVAGSMRWTGLASATKSYAHIKDLRYIRQLHRPAVMNKTG